MVDNNGKIYLSRTEALEYLKSRGVAPETFQGLYFAGMRYGLSTKLDGHVYFEKKSLKKYADNKAKSVTPEGWMTVAEAALYYKTNKLTVYTAIDEGRLPSKVIGMGYGKKVVNTNGIETIFKRKVNGTRD